MQRHLWLIGMMGAGKTTVGSRLADRLGRPFFDTDDEVAAAAGCSIADLWSDRGESVFRSMESAAVAQVAAAVPSVIASGGGVVLDPTNTGVMRASGSVVWLSARLGTLHIRVGAAGGRPLLAGADGIDRLEAILLAREDRYRAAADLIVATDGLAVDDIVDRIEAWWNAS